MKRALLLLLFALGTLRAQAAAPAGYWLAWSDECSSNDTDKFDHWLPGARRDAVNTGVAVSHSGGVRTISTFTSNGVHYTGMISTDGLFRERYGFWEASIDYDSTNGMWSAFWVQSPTMGNPVGDPAMAGSEIDICEHRSHNESGGTLHTGYDINNHWDGYGASHQSVGSRRNVGTAHSGFRTYGLLWNETEYQFYYEDTWQWTTTNGHSRRPEFAILSSEVEDGSWAGAILPGGYGSYASPKARMKIDYVRWYAPSNYTIWCGGDTNGSWAATNNWVAGRTPQSPRVVVFDDFTRSNYVTHLDANRTVAGLVVTDPWGVPTISSNTLTLGSDGHRHGDERAQPDPQLRAHPRRGAGLERAELAADRQRPGRRRAQHHQNRRRLADPERLQRLHLRHNRAGGHPADRPQPRAGQHSGEHADRRGRAAGADRGRDLSGGPGARGHGHRRHGRDAGRLKCGRDLERHHHADQQCPDQAGRQHHAGAERPSSRSRTGRSRWRRMAGPSAPSRPRSPARAGSSGAATRACGTSPPRRGSAPRITT
jgi:beta-glucanase (GH16 family)